MKYVPTAFAGQYSGSLGSTTASRNRFGSYFRNRVMPVNPATTKQGLVRASFAELTEGWRALTESERTAWSSLGAQMTRTNSLGQTYTLTGHEAFMSINRNQYTLGNAAVNEAPAFTSPPDVTSLTVTADDGTVNALSVAFAPSPVPADMNLVIEAGPAVSDGVNFFPRSYFKTMAIVAAAGTTPQSILTAWETAFGSIEGKATMKIAVRARFVSETGFSGAAVTAQTVVVST